jgi:Ca-activated chloride channel family protein
MKKAALAFLFGLLFAFTAQAQLIDVAPDHFRPPDRFPPPQTPASWAVESRFVDMQVRNQVASVSVTETLLNTCGRVFEAEYYIPIPDGASVDQLTLTVNGHELTGEILSADRARRRYEDIVRRKRDPALLEYAGMGCIKVSAFPLEPGKPAQLSLHYSMLCPKEGDVVELQFPLANARHSSAPVKEIRVIAEIHGQAELLNIYSPTVQIDTRFRGDREATVTYTTANCYPSADFVVYFTEDNREIGATFLTYFPERNKDGYYMMLVSPSHGANSSSPIAKDILIVLDRSGSMSGEKIKQARDAVSFVINNLNADDRFDFITYNGGVESCFGSLTSATRKNRDTALDEVDRVEASGGTNIHDALTEAMDELVSSSRQASLIGSPTRPAYVLFLTDGLPTVGTTDEQRIIDDARKANELNARLFCFGVGYDVNVRLLDNLSNDQNGKSAYVKPDENIEEKVSSLYSKIKNPVMTDLRAELEGFRLRDRHPDMLRDLFENDQIVQVGRISNDGDGYRNTTLKISGTYLGEGETFSYPVEVNTSNRRSSYKFIEKLWAQRRVAFLLNEVRLKGQNEELVNEIVDLATRYGIVTPYTSFLADENQMLSDASGVKSQVKSMSRTLHEETVGAAPQAASKSLSDMSMSYYITPNSSLHARGARDTEAKWNSDPIQTIGGEPFYKRAGYWIQSTLTKIDVTKDLGSYPRIQRYSEEYFALIKRCTPEESALLSGQSEGEKYLVWISGQTYIIE